MKIYRKCALCCTSKFLEKYKNSNIKRFVCNFCDYGFIGSPIYVFVLGIIGTATTAFDIVRIMNIKFPIKYSAHRNTSSIPLTIKRDLKCMSGILGMEHYTLVLLGIITDFPILHIQWLLLQACIIIAEISIFFIRIIMDGLHIKFSEILQILISIFNWLQVFCLFLRQLKMETVYTTLTYLLIACLSYITLEIGARSPLGHSVTRSATFNALFRRNYDIKITIKMENLMSALITTVLICIGEKWRIPHLYIPWLLNIIRGIITYEGPTLFILLYNQLSHAVIPASTFALIAIILIVEEICVWCDVMEGFKKCWSEQVNYMKPPHENQCKISNDKKNEIDMQIRNSLY